MLCKDSGKEFYLFVYFRFFTLRYSKFIKQNPVFNTALKLYLLQGFKLFDPIV